VSNNHPAHNQPHNPPFSYNLTTFPTSPTISFPSPDHHGGEDPLLPTQRPVVSVLPEDSSHHLPLGASTAAATFAAAVTAAAGFDVEELAKLLQLVRLEQVQNGGRIMEVIFCSIYTGKNITLD